MESCTILPFSRSLSLFSRRPDRDEAGPASSLFNRRSSHPARIRCQKMYVPGFGEASPERKAANHLHKFFTYIAVRIVSAQLQSYNREAYDELTDFLSRNSLNDGDKFCADLMRESSRHQSLALRILEVRSAYCKQDFEWDNLKRVASKVMDEANTRLMKEYVLETTRVETESGK